MSHYTKPLVALSLAIIPFFIFIGSTDTVTINGELVSDNRFNLGGLIMAGIGLAMVFAVLRPWARTTVKAKAIAAVAGLLCLVQILNSIDVIRIDPLDWIMPDRHLPALTYSSLGENDRIYLTVKTPETYRNALTNLKGNIIGETRLHRDYADLCHGGRYRVDFDRAEQLPDYFSTDEREKVEETGSSSSYAAPTECSAARSNSRMGTQVDNINRQMDLFDRLEAEYLATIQ